MARAFVRPLHDDRGGDSAEGVAWRRRGGLVGSSLELEWTNSRTNHVPSGSSEYESGHRGPSLPPPLRHKRGCVSIPTKRLPGGGLSWRGEWDYEQVIHYRDYLRNYLCRPWVPGPLVLRRPESLGVLDFGFLWSELADEKPSQR